MIHKNAHVWEMAERLSDPIRFVDDKGQTKYYRFYLWLGNWGVTDLMAHRVVFPATYPNIEIDTQCGVIITGTDGLGWSIFPLDGSPIGFKISEIAPERFQSIYQLKRWLTDEAKF